MVFQRCASPLPGPVTEEPRTKAAVRGVSGVMYEAGNEDDSTGNTAGEARQVMESDSAPLLYGLVSDHQSSPGL